MFVCVFATAFECSFQHLPSGQSYVSHTCEHVVYKQTKNIITVHNVCIICPILSTLSQDSTCTLAQTVDSSKPSTKFSMFMLLPFYGESQRVGERDIKMVIRGCRTMWSFERGNLLIYLIPFCLPICPSRLMSRGLHQQSSHHTFCAHIRNRG